MIHVSVGDEEEVLRDGALRAPADVEGQLQGRQDHARLVARNRQPLDRVSLDHQFLAASPVGARVRRFRRPLLRLFLDFRFPASGFRLHRRKDREKSKRIDPPRARARAQRERQELQR